MLTRWIELLLTALGIAIVCGSSAPRRDQAAPGMVRIASDDDVALERILARLRQPAKGWEFIDAPVREVMKWISRELDVPIKFDASPAVAEAMPKDYLITRRVVGQTCEQALTDLAGDFTLGWYVQQGTIVIAQQDDCRPNLPTRIYPVGDLVQLRDKQGAYDAGDELAMLVDNSLSHVAPNNAVPGLELSVEYQEADHCLIVRAIHEKQQRVAQLLQGLRLCRDRQGISGFVARTPAVPPPGGVRGFSAFGPCF